MNYLNFKSLSILKPLKRSLAVGLSTLAMFGFAQNAWADSEQDAGTILYAFHGYSPIMDGDTDLGLYTMTTEGETDMLWPDEVIGVTGTYISLMWMQDGSLHTLYGNKTKFFHIEFDFETGQPLTVDQIDVSGDNAYKYIRRGAYNPNDGYIYGYSWNADETKDYYVKTPASDPSQVTIIREMPQDFVACSANCFNPEDNCMYGIDVYKSLVRVDVHGNFSYTNLITTLDRNLHGVVTGLVYSPTDKCYYWNARYDNYASEFVKIDPTNIIDMDMGGYTEKFIVTENIKWFRTFDAYVSLLTFDSTGAPDGPVAPEMISYNFKDGETSGSIVYKMPAKLANGGDAPASMKWEATNGADATSTGTAAPGEEVTVNYTNLSDGEYTFWFRAYNGEQPGELNVNTLWVGSDVPAVPTNVTFESTPDKGKYLVTWDPVTKGAHNGYLDLNKVVYQVYLNGQTLIATSKSCEAVVDIDYSGEDKEFYVVVYAISGTRVSEPAYSSSIYIGEGFKLPFTITPTSDQVNMMTYINPENDSLGWRPFTCPPDIPTFYTGNSDLCPGNDWLITPHMMFPDKSALFQLSYDVAIWNITIPDDYYDIWIGTEPTAEGIMQTQLLTKSQPNSMNFVRKTIDFYVPEAGAYYIGFRCLSDPKQGGILIKNISVKQLTEGGVENVTDAPVKVIGGHGYIAIEGSDNATLSVYSLDGVCIYSGTVSQDTPVAVRPGLYVAVCNGVSHKIVVK